MRGRSYRIAAVGMSELRPSFLCPRPSEVRIRPAGCRRALCLSTSKQTCAPVDDNDPSVFVAFPLVEDPTTRASAWRSDLRRRVTRASTNDLTMGVSRAASRRLPSAPSKSEARICASANVRGGRATGSSRSRGADPRAGQTTVRTLALAGRPKDASRAHPASGLSCPEAERRPCRPADPPN